ncbi:endonuclease/exonuclease/phosphatase family protein [Pontibacter anaerobius]|uniref:Endonuclease/exonuclease/phosphatase family protein n=1 Tax=Pontibacter anaerobius TaxID=2993940 RepID=A0ABT3RJU6_9BACT|nr:endonuclease/exonuclease/phosphatase family protein [Pontibacter anaerobius]MCX2741964.1 endonuclease/exonuclease/phosphatase family protein [Pontibacter anaerobius]
MKQAFIILIRALAAIAVIGTVIPLFSSEEWYVRVFDFPRLQLFFLAVISLVLFYFFDYQHRKRGKLLLFTLVTVVVYQSINIYPYTILSPVQTEQTERDLSDTTHLSILVSNVLMTNTAYSHLIEMVNSYEPDVLLALESDSAWQEGLKEVTKAYPYRVEVPLPNTYGMHLYSKLPLRQKKVSYILDDEIPSIKTYMQLRSGAWIEFRGVHPKPPVPTEEEHSRKRDAEIIIVGREVADSKYPVVVAGDFNDVAWSPTTRLFQEVSQLLDPRVGRGFFSTYHAHYPMFRWPLDHIFHSNHFKLVEMKRLKGINSDHFPIFVTLSYEPDEKYEQVAPAPDEDTHEEAVETIQEGVEEAQKEGKQPDTLTTK